MPQFFFQSNKIINNEYVLEGDDYHHLSKVRRIKIGDSIHLRNESGVLFLSKVKQIDNNNITLEIVSKIEEKSSNIHLSIYVCLLKGTKLDLVVQKAVEIGVHEIVPVNSERSMKFPLVKYEKKVERWNRIAIEASKQSMRNDIPLVRSIHSFKEVMNFDVTGTKIIANPDADISLKSFMKNCDEKININLLVGPEGGFSDVEVETALSNGWINVSFGLTQMRAETAGIVLPSLILYELSK